MLKMAFCAFKIFRDNIWKMTPCRPPPQIWNFPYVLSLFFLKASLSNNTQKRMWSFWFGWSGDGIGDTVDTQVEKLTTRVPLPLIREYVISSSHHYISRFKLRFLLYFICSTFTPILSRVCFWASLCHFAWDFSSLIVNTCVNRHTQRSKRAKTSALVPSWALPRPTRANMPWAASQPCPGLP